MIKVDKSWGFQMDSEQEKIIIDKDKGLVFDNEQELLEFFAPDINKFEEELFHLRSKKDIPEKQFTKFEKNLEELIESPDEVWEELDSTEQENLAVFLKYFPEQKAYHIALTYLTDDIPSFIYLHFPSNDEELIEKYRRGQLIYDAESDISVLGAIDGDSLMEGDSLARGLYEAMLKLRSSDDIPEDHFIDYAAYREESIEQADEIWRSNNSAGHVLVTFIKEYSVEGQSNFFYVAVTQEDGHSNTHALLFTFPTQDTSLVERYRNGENLQADEVVQESSH